MDPVISVILATRDRAALLREAIGSVLAQTRRDFELIVVDDGSEEDTSAVARAFADPRVRFLPRPRRGLGAALNAGLEAARGRFIARNDSDDVWLPDLLATLVPRLEADDALGFVYGRCDVVSADLSRTLGVRGTPLRYPDDALRSLLYADTTASIASVYRRTSVEAVGGWSQRRRWNGDWALALGVARTAQAAYVDARVALIRRHPGGITWEGADTFDARLRAREGVLDELFASADLRPSALAMRPIAYRNLYTAAGMQLLGAGRWRDAAAELWRAVRAGRSRAAALAHVLWTAFGWFGVGRVRPAAALALRATARLRRSAAIVALLALGCAPLRNWAFPDEGYEAVGEPALPLEAAKAECLEQTEFESGLSMYQGHDWERFRECMRERGFQQPSD